MILKKISSKKIGDVQRVEITFLFKNRLEIIWFEVANKNFTIDERRADVFLSLALLPAMLTDENIDISKFYVSPLLLASIEKIQNLYVDWFKELSLRKVHITHAETKPPALFEKERITVSFFSGGVDSFDTVINTENEQSDEKIQKLLYVHGYDVRLSDKKLFTATKRILDKAADELRKEIVYVSTNLREFTERFVGWDFIHGPALISIAHLFNPTIKTIYIPASNSVGQFTPNGSHPNLDPLFMSETLEIIHYGTGRKRIDKILKNISKSETALKYLRVCWKNSGGKINCGVCEKCIRTMVALEVAGVLGKTQTFHTTLNKELLANIKIPNEGTANLYRELLPYLSETPLLRIAKSCIMEALNNFDNFVRRTMSQGKEVTKSSGFVRKVKNILFVDFNGVVSYNPFWASLRDPNHELYSFSEAIERYLFKNNKSIITDWMIGKYTAEHIHKLLERELGVPYEKLFPVFCEDCKMIDLSIKVLERVRRLRDFYHCVLITDNMDSFERFTLVHNSVLAESFDKIDNSYVIGRFKKSNDGQYFKDRISEQGAITANCILIDDSKNNSALFESIGGNVYVTKSEDEAVVALDSIYETAQSKWEWQY